MNFVKSFSNLFIHHNNYSFKNILIFHLCIIISYEYLLSPINDLYPHLKILPSGDYFVLLKNGIYIYNNDFSNNTLIREFTGSEIIDDEYESYGIILSEIKNDTNFYILCFVKGSLFLFDDEKKKITKFTFQTDFYGYYYNLIPYEIDNNYLNYCIIFTKYEEKCGLFWAYKQYSLHLYHFRINLLLLNENEKIKSNTFNDNCHINDYIFSCQFKAPQSLYCFYLIDKIKKIEIAEFNIGDFKKTYKNKYSNDYINQIYYLKSSESTKENIIFF